MKTDFEIWKEKKLKKEKKEKDISETIKIKKIEKLSGDRGYHLEGTIKNHYFTAGCVNGNWFKGWNVGILKGTENNNEYKELCKVIKKYLNKNHPKGDKNE